MSEQFRILIGGTDYAPHIDHSSVTATNNVVKTTDNMSFTVVLRGELPAPRAGMEVVWQRWDTVTQSEITREFGGVISSVSETVDAGNLVYECAVQSYIRWFDRRLVTGFFQQQSCEDFINLVVSKYCPGFTTDGVVAPYTIVPQYSNYQRPSNLVRNACDQVGLGWYIDSWKRLKTFKAEDFASPLPNNLLDVDNDVTNYGDLVLTEDSEQVFNRFTVRGYKQRAKYPYTLRFKGDGTTTQWSLGYRFSSATGDSVCTVGGVNYPVKKDILDGLPGQASTPGVCFIHFTQHTIRFALPPGNGVIVEFTGYPLIDKVRVDQDDASIEYMRALENNPSSDGVYELADTDKSLSQSTQDAITSKLQLMALKYGFPTIAGSFTSFTQGWQAGQTFRMTSAIRMGGLSADARYYVHKVTKRWIQPMHGATHKIQYTVEFSDKPYLLA